MNFVASMEPIIFIDSKSENYRSYEIFVSIFQFDVLKPIKYQFEPLFFHKFVEMMVFNGSKRLFSCSKNVYHAVWCSTKWGYIVSSTSYIDVAPTETSVFNRLQGCVAYGFERRENRYVLRWILELAGSYLYYQQRTDVFQVVSI